MKAEVPSGFYLDGAKRMRPTTLAIIDRVLCIEDPGQETISPSKRLKMGSSSESMQRSAGHT
jgi:hypothetical protein